MIRKLKISRSASQIIIESENKDEFLFMEYDETYPISIYRKKINLIGGGSELGDTSPKYAIEREIKEEFSSQPDFSKDITLIQVAGNDYTKQRIESFASENDIALAREAILYSMKPYKDFIVNIPAFPHGPLSENYMSLFSIFYSMLSKEIFECIRCNLSSGKSLVNEGFLKIVKKEELILGKAPTAWALSPTMQDFLKTPIPNHDEVLISYIGTPRESFRDYKEIQFKKLK